jgi:hypothetical protein
MKTTIDISDALFEQARAQAKAQGMTMRTLVENGLRLALAQSRPVPERFVLLDFSFGADAAAGELTELSDPAQWRESASSPWSIDSGALVRSDGQP